MNNESSGKTVIQAITAVMDDVQSVKKGDRNAVQNFNFRGIDAVVNAVGPALRKHGVVAVPTTVAAQFEHYNTSKGAAMKSTVLTITWRFYGPMGDWVDAQTMGEASDAGDKSVPKAHSVAYRTLLLQALCIPTDEPDPDSETHQRGEAEPLAGMDERAGIDAAIKALTDEQKAVLRLRWTTAGLPKPDRLTESQATVAQHLLATAGTA